MTDKADNNSGFKKLADLWASIEDHHRSFLYKLDGKAINKVVNQLLSTGKLTPNEKILIEDSGLGDTQDILEKLNGIWIGFVLWDSMSSPAQFRLLKQDFFREPSRTERKGSRSRYEFITNLLSSDEFKKKGFIEPFSEYSFKKKSKNIAVCFYWKRTNGSYKPFVKKVSSSASGTDILEIQVFNFTFIDSSDLQSRLKEIIKLLPTASIEENALHLLRIKILNQVDECVQIILKEHDKLFREQVVNFINLFSTTPQSKSNGSSIEEIQKQICRALIWNRLFDDEWEYIYYIPAMILDRGAVSGMVLATTRVLNFAEEYFIQEVVNRIFGSFHFILHEMEIKSHQIRTAASAILARNLSHNIGSHVIPRAHLKQVKRRTQELFKKTSNQPINKDDDFVKVIESKKDTLDEYIRQKADFLAEISTKAINSSSTLRLYRDILLPFISNTVLIDCLAANEGFRYTSWYKSNLQIRLIRVLANTNQSVVHIYTIDPNNQDTKNISRQRTIPYGEGTVHKQFTKFRESYGKSSTFTLKNRTIVNENSDISIAVPGNLGKFSIYGILENIIRNAAKHNLQSTNKELLEITLVVKETETNSSYVSLFIYDNLSNPDMEVNNDDETLKDYINDEMNKPLVGSSGEVRPSAWGLAEIVIASNLLIGSTNYTNGNGNKRVNILAKSPQALWGSNEDDSNINHLVYELKLLKSRQAIFIGKQLYEALTAQEAEKNTEWENVGISFVEEWDALPNFFERPGTEMASFQFAIVDETSYQNSQRHDYRQLLPFRVIRIAPAADPGIDKQTGDLIIPHLDIQEFSPADSPSLMQQLWHTWCRRWLDLNPIDGNPSQGMIGLYLDDIRGMDELIMNWTTAKREFNNKEYKHATVNLEVGFHGSGSKSFDEPKSSELRKVVFDRHGSSTMTVDINHGDTYIAFDKTNKDFQHIFQPHFPATDEAWSFPFELFEAGMLRVLILDERLIERAMLPIVDSDNVLNTTLKNQVLGGEDGKPCMWHIAYSAQIFLVTHVKPQTKSVPRPEKEILDRWALHSESYKKSSKKYEATKKEPEPCSCPALLMDLDKGVLRLSHVTPLNSFAQLKEFETLKIDSFDMIVVHQGVLDKLDGEFVKKSNSSEASNLLECLRKFCPWIVVESGRGMPPDVQENNEKFIPFSAFDQYFGEARIAKLNLCKRLMESNRTLRGKNNG